MWPALVSISLSFGRGIQNLVCFHFQTAVPGRFKDFHFININPLMEAFISIVKPVMPKKLQERVSVRDVTQFM